MATTAPMNNSRGSTDSLILDVLRGAGLVGLHVNDISHMIGLSEKKATLSRLFALQKQSQVEQHPGEIWRIKANSIKLEQKVQDANGSMSMDSSIADPYEQPEVSKISPYSGVLPTIILPGMYKFASYKNSLQEYCQKLAFPVPVYRIKSDSVGNYVCTVSFSTNAVTSQQSAKTTKDAESMAAFEALKQLGYFNEDVNFEHTNVLKRKMQVEGDTPASKIQHTNDGLAYSQQTGTKNLSSYKSQLNELAQKNRLPLPSYDTVIAPSNGFFSTVTFNGRQFKSCNPCPKKKDSEQSAAHMALHLLIGIPLDGNVQAQESPKLETSDVSNMISEARTAATSSLKNRLQEYCQRLKKDLPKYETTMTDLQCVSIVTVDGKQYTGLTKQQKKLAEMSAAEVALKSLGLMATEACDTST